MNSRRHTLAGCVAVALAVSLAPMVVQAEDTATSNSNELEAVNVSALPLGSGSPSTPYSVMDQQTLTQKNAATLGETLNNQPGVHSDTFGGGASRPVIRGQSGPRVGVLNDGSAVLDASSISPDHTVTVDPMLARQIEVLRGPSTLLYGSGASGGVVNVLDSRIPTERPREEVEGFVGVRANTVADANATAAGITFSATDHLVFRVEGSRRDADDYEVDGFDRLTVPGTFAESDNSSIGASWIGDQGFFGMAYSYRRDNYGLPGHNHEFEECGVSRGRLDCPDEEHDHEHGEEVTPFVDLASRRVDARGEYRNPMDGITAIRFRGNHTEYRHHEIEEGEIGTTFRNRGGDARLEVEHAPIGNWRGVVGMQYTDFDFSSLGGEAFVPKTESRAMALFAVEEYRLNDQWRFELGARQEHQRLRPEDRPGEALPDLKQDSTSLSAAANWAFVPGYELVLSVGHSERAPSAQELYAEGVHLATNTYECGLFSACGGGQRDLDDEISLNANLNLRKTQGDWLFDLGVFENRINNYLYARTLDQIEDFRLIKYSQRDATFTGAEASVSYYGIDPIGITVFGDMVRATFDDGGYLPRIPAKRLGTRLNTYVGHFDAELEYYRSFAQDQIAGFEDRTAAYDMANVTVSYRLRGDQRYTFYVRGNNLLGEEVFNHSSFLASTVPEPGRNLTVGTRIEF
ncbi:MULTISPECIES: TonB-dependent receptor domain-containing protein [Alcanivorax]|mgnify:FL=1|jgi:iron complex outermembrane receptor protein|uniref:TonB-dependent receptor domain-containing protein n=2 Tax=Alcanivoracaceae TaxID=224372 RepID=UPI000C6549F9|nr:TonB-dependent receptor [Alcanivorax jadensis]MBG32881.1 TonB-dependent receptor [Alcanivorax sp.]MDF1636323.1 TonB-dependent receptor [Alcanivorax jadensis]|tara:strand:- start:152 stop:2218 length:2067 start_codon:yes stop_codon:yes gene_type:complete